MKHYKYLLFSLILLSACQEKSTKTFLISDLVITAEPPLYDGPNTLQAQIKFDPKSIDAMMRAEDIEHVKLVKAEIGTTDTAGFDHTRNLVLQFASANAPMQKAAVLNPVPKSMQNVSMLPSSETDLSEHFKHSEITIVLDADLEGDREETITYQGSMEFEVTYKK